MPVRRSAKKPPPRHHYIAWWLERPRPRFRLLLAGLVAMATALVLPGDLRLVTRLLAGWNVGVALYLAMALYIMAVSSVDDIRRRAAAQDEGRFALLSLTVAAAIASLGAIIIEIGKPEGGGEPQAASFALAIATILLSWAFIQMIFTLHYAHEFYFVGGGEKGGLDFPGEAEQDADYWDFLYVAITVGMTFQTSDVAVTSRPMRRLVTVHASIAFIFNTAIIALSVNIAGAAI